MTTACHNSIPFFPTFDTDTLSIPDVVALEMPYLVAAPTLGEVFVECSMLDVL